MAFITKIKSTGKEILIRYSMIWIYKAHQISCMIEKIITTQHLLTITLYKTKTEAITNQNQKLLISN